MKNYNFSLSKTQALVIGIFLELLPKKGEIK
jgi:hypothetical protein